jgi:hypothetical protein
MARLTQTPKIRIVMTEASKGYIEVDGFRLPGTYDLTFEAEVGNIPRLHVSMWATDIEIEAEGAQISIDAREPEPGAEITTFADFSRKYAP